VSELYAGCMIRLLNNISSRI